MKYSLLLLFSFFSLLYSQDSLMNSKVHHTPDGFRNPYPGFESHGLKSLAKWMLWDRLIKESRKEETDTIKFEIASNNPQWLRKNNSEFSLTWVGHSTLLIQLDGLNILTDPIWSERSSPVSFAGPKRFVKPGISFIDLPKIDIVIISHNHYDHLDTKTIEQLGNDPLYLIPLGLASYFADLGITNYQELDWWEEIKFNNINFVCTPTQHFSGRTLFDRDKTLWCSWVIEGSQKIYFAGDTGYFPAFKDIGKKYGPFDLAAIPIGAYEPRWFMRSVHTDPREAVDIYEDVKAKYFIPIHWGTFQLADEPMKDPPKVLLEEARKRKLDLNLFKILKHGETFVLPKTDKMNQFDISTP
jgi:L-ascorbate metabolism protein UlaG (beta-lactamase superfamily)